MRKEKRPTRTKETQPLDMKRRRKMSTKRPRLRRSKPIRLMLMLKKTPNRRWNGMVRLLKNRMPTKR